MKIHEFLEKNTADSFSVEIIPPKRGASASDLLTAIERIMPYGPRWVDVTSHGADVTWKPQPDGSFTRSILRKRPGTLSLCAVVKYQFGVETVPHLLCNGFTKDETEDSLIELHFLGIRNVLALRGDHSARLPHPDAKVNSSACQLVEQVAALKRGVYLEEFEDQCPMDFDIGVACYPERHHESPNVQFDLQNLKAKENLGAQFAISQMFFDTDGFLAWERRARDFGVRMPVIPGLKIINSRRHFLTLPKSFHISLPERLTQRLMACTTNAEATEAGVDWAVEQVQQLRAAGFRHLHFFLMQDVDPFVTLLKRLKSG